MRASEQDHHYGWHRIARPFFAIGEHRESPGHRGVVRAYVGVAAAALVTVLSVGLYLHSVWPTGQLAPDRSLPGVDRPFDAISESAAAERLWATDRPRGSRSTPRPTAAPVPGSGVSRVPAVPRPPNESSSPAAGAPPQPLITMLPTICPPPLPPSPTPKTKRTRPPHPHS